MTSREQHSEDIGMSPEAPHPPNSSDDGPISRRAFLTRAALGGGVILSIPMLLALKQEITTDHQHDLAEAAAEQAHADEQEILEGRNHFVKSGMAHYWEDASVWPGLAIMPPNVQLYGQVMLQPGSEISWPKGKQDEHLAVQRPFLILETMKDEGYNPDFDVDGNTTPGKGVMGFWLPESQQIAFCDQEAFSSRILLPTNSNETLYRAGIDGEEMIGESVHLEPATHREGLTYRYLQYENKGAFGYHETVQKVVGRSQWVNFRQEAVAFTAFQTGLGSDIVQLPETH